ncbi:hypothetical protein CALCODRAFT_259234 [Calocera cornea HHB12733]|uniref:Uncharacterized protein n=1 Tax=Calocera cornea HHB12733 TaxID=1353952 RepID=A0A165GH84_9BASI|nr:hypothetical protein CALCODRAFT_259234 [Calocera cornea HHB12733]
MLMKTVMSLPQTILLVYLEPIVFSILGAIPVVQNPTAFQAGHAPANFSPNFLTLANRVALYQYAALLVVVGLSSTLVMHTALRLDDPTGRSQFRILSAMQISLMIGDSLFASASLVFTGQAPYLMAPFLGVWLSASLSLMRVTWLFGLGRQSFTEKKVQ